MYDLKTRWYKTLAKALLSQAKDNNEMTTSLLINHTSALQYVSAQGYQNTLLNALHTGKTEIFDMMIKACTYPQVLLDVSLVDAAKRGDIEDIDRLIKSGAQLEANNYETLRSTIHYNQIKALAHLVDDHGQNIHSVLNAEDVKMLSENHASMGIIKYINENWSEDQWLEYHGLQDDDGNSNTTNDIVPTNIPAIQKRPEGIPLH